MDNITNATRISSSVEQTEGMESSHPFDENDCVVAIGRPESLDNNIGRLEPLDNNISIERLAPLDKNVPSGRRRPLEKTYQVERIKPRNKIVRAPKEVISPAELFHLNLLILGEQKLSQMSNNNIISRIKGKKSIEEYRNTIQILHQKRETFQNGLEEIYNRYLSSIQICILPVQAMPELLDLFQTLPFTKANQRVNQQLKQRDKLRFKIEARLQSCGCRIDAPPQEAEITRRLQHAFPGNKLAQALEILKSPKLRDLLTDSIN